MTNDDDDVRYNAEREMQVYRIIDSPQREQTVDQSSQILPTST